MQLNEISQAKLWMIGDVQSSTRVQERKSLLPVRGWEAPHRGVSGCGRTWACRRVVQGGRKPKRKHRGGEELHLHRLGWSTEHFGVSYQRWCWRKDQCRFLGPCVTSRGARDPFPRQCGARTGAGALCAMIRAGLLWVDLEGRWRKREFKRRSMGTYFFLLWSKA